MNKTARKLVPAIFMLVIAMVFASTSSYAWFSMNKTVTATGMSVKAEADTSLVIKGIKDTSYSATGTNELSALTMKPSTSFDGISFGYLSTGNAVPSAASSTVTWNGGTFDTTDLTLATSTGTYYATTTYSLKSIAEAAEHVYVKSITITTSNTALKPALRVSVTKGTTTLVFNAGGGTNTAEGVGKYEGSAWTLAVPTYETVNNAGADIGSLATDVAEDVIVNIWFEGQDTACFSDNVNTNNFTLVIEFTTVTPS